MWKSANELVLISFKSWYFTCNLQCCQWQSSHASSTHYFYIAESVMWLNTNTQNAWLLAHCKWLRESAAIFRFTYTVLIITKIYAHKVLIPFHCVNSEVRVISVEVVVLLVSVSIFTDLLTEKGTVVAQWLRWCATNREVAGSIPAGVSGFFIDIKSFRSHYGPGVDSASNRNEFQEYFLWWQLTTVMKYGNLNFLEPSGPLQASNGTAVP